MSERKNIERLFQEKFKDFEVEPTPQVWEGIASKLEKKENKRRVIPFWLKASGIAASLVLGYFVADQYTGWSSEFNSDKNNSETIVSSEASNDNKENNAAVKQKNSTTKNDNINEQNSQKTSIVANENVQDHQKNTSKINQSTLKTSNAGLVSSEKIGNKKANSSEKRNLSPFIKKDQFQSNTSNEIAHTSPKNHSKRSHSNTSSLDEKDGFSSDKTNQSIVQNNTSANSQFNKSNVVNKSNQNNAVGTDKLSNNWVENHNDDNISSNDKVRNNAIAATNNPKANQNNAIGKDKLSNNLVEDHNNDANISFKDQIQNNAMAESNKQKANSEKLILNDQQNTWIAYAVAVNPNVIADNAQVKDSTALAVVEENPLEKLLREKESKEKEKIIIADNSPKWKIKPNVAPLFMNANQGSPIDDQFADNTKDFENNLSVGLGLDYALSPKFAIRTGINKFNVGYNTNDIAYYVDLNSKDNSNNTIQTINMKPEYSIVVEDRNASSGNQELVSQNIDEGFLNQRFGYIEVPFEVSYKLVDKKFGVQIITGLSTLFLNENKVSVVSNGFSTELGEANNLNKIHYSTNIGVGFKYSFWKSFEANFEPTFKYQINTFNANSGGFKPYLIGLYTGISFKF
ncbi:hypothetical protein [Flavobacterium sp.]|uniref:hypothetical protein n=1 Tax=Flavobacterium sp. TaxID=239 RepID=UPI002633DDE1|nr:hypothetical protein [Flavobacterium sp.]